MAYIGWTCGFPGFVAPGIYFVDPPGITTGKFGPQALSGRHGEKASRSGAYRTLIGFFRKDE